MTTPEEKRAYERLSAEADDWWASLSDEERERYRAPKRRGRLRRIGLLFSNLADSSFGFAMGLCCASIVTERQIKWLSLALIALWLILDQLSRRFFAKGGGL